MPNYSASTEPFGWLDELEQLITSLRKGTPKKKDESAATIQVVRLAATLLEGLLRLGPADVSFSAFLEQIVQRMTIDPSKERERRQLVDRIDYRGRKGWLNQSCGQCAHDLLLLRARLMMARPAVVLPVAKTRKQPSDIGPREGCVFRWYGVDHPLSRKRWCLLKCVWGTKGVAEEDAMKAIYGLDRPGGTKLRQLEHQTNCQLQKLGLPYKIFRPRIQCLAVRKLKNRRG